MMMISIYAFFLQIIYYGILSKKKELIIFIGTPELCGPALYFMAQLQIYFHRAAQRRQA